jgi:hypothetical protein
MVETLPSMNKVLSLSPRSIGNFFLKRKEKATKEKDFL